MTRIRILLASLTTLLATSLLLVASPAGAVVSGVNGRIVFASDRDGDKEIYVMRSDGTAVIQLTTNTSNDYDPAVSGDGQKIAFISDRDGAAELYVMNVDGTNQTRLSTNLGTVVESHPSWAPNGSAITYAGLSGTDSEIYTVKPDGTHVINLTNDTTAFDDHPSWSPGGIRLAFDSTNRGGDPSTQVYTMNNDGTLLTKITTTGNNSNPSWAPDNKNLTFESTRDSSPGGPSVFATNLNKPIGIAVTTSKVLVTLFNSDKIKGIDSNGTVTNFASLPPTGMNIERYLAVSSGLGGFPTDGSIYATAGQNIYKVSPDGLTVTLFVNIPALATGETGITFDTVGTFAYRMILTDRRGPVWAVDSAGTATQIGDVGAQIEGPLVAPLSFAPYGGQILSGNEFQDQVFALAACSPEPCMGAVSRVIVSESPEVLLNIPSPACNFGTSNGAYFIAMENENTIYKFGSADFGGLGGKILAPAELTTEINVLDSVGGTITASQFWPAFATPDMEGSAFAPCTSGSPRQTGQPSAATTHDIYKMTSTGANQLRLTTDLGDDINPAFSPDGLTIAFQTDRDDPGLPGCEDLGTCKYEVYTMNSSDGSNQTNISNNLTTSDGTPDWQAVSRVVSVKDFLFDPAVAKPSLGGTVLWDFAGTEDHTATDNSGMGLFDSGIKSTGAYYVFKFVGAGSYPVICTIHPTMLGTVKVPMTAAPKTGNLTTTFTITWAAANAPSGYNFDIQIQRPGGSFVDWKTNMVKQKSSTFVADGGTGVYNFQARLQLGTGAASNYSAPVSITVNP